jgi:hypothetical protein
MSHRGMGVLGRTATGTESKDFGLRQVKIAARKRISIEMAMNIVQRVLHSHLLLLVKKKVQFAQQCIHTISAYKVCRKRVPYENVPLASRDYDLGFRS